MPEEERIDMARLNIPCTEDHVCLKCKRNSFYLTIEPLDEEHVAVRFGDDQYHSGRDIKFTLDGRDVSRICTEAIGSKGMVRVYVKHEDGELHACPCGYGTCETELTGEVRIVRGDE